MENEHCKYKDGIAALAYYVPETRPLAAINLVTDAIEESAERIQVSER